MKLTSAAAVARSQRDGCVASGESSFKSLSPPRPGHFRRSVSAAYNIRPQLTLAPADINTDGKFEGEYAVEKVLGEGGFGKVFRAKNLVDNLVYAVKECPFFFNASQDNNNNKELLRTKSLREATMIGKLDHPNIVRYHSCWVEDKGLQIRENTSDSEEDGFADDYPASAEDEPRLTVNRTMLDSISESTESDEVFTSPPFQERGSSTGSTSSKCLKHQMNLYIQMACYETDTLQEYLLHRKEIHREENASIMKQLLHGLAYVHREGLIHRDLKPANIFMVYDRGKRLRVLIGDFGLAIGNSISRRVSRMNSKMVAFSSGKLKADMPDSATGLEDLSFEEGVGTPTYAAPEQLEGKHLSPKADIYSFGIILVELCNIFDTMMARAKIIDDARCNLTLPESMAVNFPEESKLTLAMLNRKAIHRPSSEEALEAIEAITEALEAINRKQRLIAASAKIKERTGTHPLMESVVGGSIEVVPLVRDHEKSWSFYGNGQMDEDGCSIISVPFLINPEKHTVFYQTTPMKVPMPNIHIFQELRPSRPTEETSKHGNNSVFCVAGGTPHGAFSWQLTITLNGQ